MTYLSKLSVPITKLVTFSALISICMSFALIEKSIVSGIIACLLTIAFARYYKSYNSFIITLWCVSIILAFRIDHLKKQHTIDNVFLNKPLIIQGVVESVQNNTQERNISSIFLSTQYIYNQEIGNVFLQKNILLQLPYKKASKIEPGKYIKIYKVFLKKSEPQDNFYDKFSIKENIWATVYVTSEHFSTYKKTAQNWYQSCFTTLKNHFNTTTAHLYNPLFLGKKEKDTMTLTIQHQSAYWGIAHHMARSGIHLVTLISFCLIIFHYTRIRSKFKFAICMILAILYAFITISSISFSRALCMIIFQMISKLHGFQYSSAYSLALTTLVIVIHNPFNVLFLDFQLSFGITAIIIWLFYIKWAKTIDLKNFFSIIS